MADVSSSSPSTAHPGPDELPDGHAYLPDGPSHLHDGHSPDGLPDGHAYLPDGPSHLHDGHSPDGLPDGHAYLPDGPSHLHDGHSPDGLPDGHAYLPDGPSHLPDGLSPDGPSREADELDFLSALGFSSESDHPSTVTSPKYLNNVEVKEGNEEGVGDEVSVTRLDLGSGVQVALTPAMLGTLHAFERRDVSLDLGPGDDGGVDLDFLGLSSVPSGISSTDPPPSMDGHPPELELELELDGTSQYSTSTSGSSRAASSGSSFVVGRPESGGSSREDPYADGTALPGPQIDSGEMERDWLAGSEMGSQVGSVGGEGD